MSRNADLIRNPDYHAARAAEERRLAEAAGSPTASAAHLELAEHHEGLARAAEAGPEEDAGQRVRV